MRKQNLCFGIAVFSLGLLFESMPAYSLGWGSTSTQPLVQPTLYLAQARTYKVKLGDTLSGIAYKNGISLQQIFSYNPALKANPNLIRVGQIIYLSKPSNSSSTASKPSATRRKTVQTFNLPNQRRQGSNRVGARRGNPNEECRKDTNDSLRVLLPDSNFGYTLQDYPTFFWYMPELKSQPERLELKVKPVGADSFQTYKFASNNQNSGVMSITLPAEIGPFEEGKEYQWEIRVYCTPRTFFAATGNIQRMSTDNAQLSSELENASVEDYPAILAQAGVWYDSLAILAALREEKPTDESLLTDWNTILKMIGFDNISSAPLISSK